MRATIAAHILVVWCGVSNALKPAADKGPKPVAGVLAKKVACGNAVCAPIRTLVAQGLCRQPRAVTARNWMIIRGTIRHWA